MCLTLEMLVVFMAMLPMDIIETDTDAIRIHGTEETAVWEPSGDLWCHDPARRDTARLEAETLRTPRK